MAARHGSIVYSPHASCVLQTGEFVKIQRLKKGQGYIFRIVNTCRYDDLPADVQVYWEKDGGRGDYVLAQWCVVIGDEDYPSTMPLKERAMCAGIKELVLRQYFRWYPIEGVLDAVVVWPAVDIANKEQLVHGMEDVFVIWEEENAGNWCWPCIPIDADNWATFPETHPVYGRDAHGNILQNESRTSRLWHTATLLRETISDLVTKPTAGCCNSQILRGLDSETWAICKKMFDRNHIKYIKRTSVAKGYRNDTERAAALRYEETRSWEGFEATSAAHLKAVTRALGNFWNLHCPRSRLRTYAMVHESSHAYGDHENVRAIVPAKLQESSFAAEDEAHLQLIDLMYGTTPGSDTRKRRPRACSLTIRYDFESRILSVAVCWKALPFSQVKDALEKTLVNRHQPPKPKEPKAPPPKPSWEYGGVKMGGSKEEYEAWFKQGHEPAGSKEERRKKARVQ